MIRERVELLTVELFNRPSLSAPVILDLIQNPFKGNLRCRAIVSRGNKNPITTRYNRAAAENKPFMNSRVCQEIPHRGTE